MWIRESCFLHSRCCGSLQTPFSDQRSPRGRCGHREGTKARSALLHFVSPLGVFHLSTHARPRSLALLLFHVMSDDETCPKPALEEACKKHCVKYLVAYEVRKRGRVRGETRRGSSFVLALWMILNRAGQEACSRGVSVCSLLPVRGRRWSKEECARRGAAREETHADERRRRDSAHQGRRARATKLFISVPATRVT